MATWSIGERALALFFFLATLVYCILLTNSHLFNYSPHLKPFTLRPFVLSLHPREVRAVWNLVPTQSTVNDEERWFKEVEEQAEEA